MDVNTFTDYEIVIPDTNESFIVKEHYEAIAYWKDTHLVFERHHTVHNPTLFIQTHMTVTRQWHNNPEFREED